ncbi:MAG: serine/threonine-protein kinase, partial [Myxococcota bacterium]
DKRVAVKLLHSHFVGDEGSVRRFQREAKAAAAIAHPHIIEIHDMGADGAAVFMVLEFLEGRSLADALTQDGPMSVGRTIHIVDQVCDALGAAHERGIVHRDLKPDNVYLVERKSDRDFVKLLDFGIAKVLETVTQHQLTKTGAAVGTPHYMAPEQASGRKDLDHRADIFALGVMTYEMLSGAPPFDDESYPMLLVKLCTEAPPPLGELRPDLPEPLVAAVDRMMAKERDARFDSVSDVAEALAPFRDLTDAPTVNAVPQHPRASSGVRESLRADPTGKTQLADSTDAVSGGSAAPATEPPMQKPRTVWFFAVGLAAAGLIAGAFAAVSLNRDEGGSEELAAPSTDNSISDEPEPGEPDPTERAPAAESAVATSTYRVFIAAEPSAATLTLDGRAIDNPFEGSLPADAEMHEIEAALEGYIAQTRSTRFYDSQRIRFTLERESRRRRPREPRVESMVEEGMEPRAETRVEPSEGRSGERTEPAVQMAPPEPPPIEPATLTTDMTAPSMRTPLKQVPF